MNERDFDPTDRDAERDRLFGVARASTGGVPTKRREALRAAVLTAAVASAASATSTAAAATSAASVASKGAAASAVSPIGTTGANVAVKTLLGGLAGMVVGGVIVGVAALAEPSRNPAPPPSAPVVTASPAPPPRSTVPSAPVTAASSEAATPAPSASVVLPRVVVAPLASRDIVNKVDELVERAPVAAPASATLADETAALRDVSRALAEGNSDEALRLLDRPAAGGALAEERAAARIVALCKSGRRDQAEPMRAAFFAEHPRSTQRDRIERACRADAKEE